MFLLSTLNMWLPAGWVYWEPWQTSNMELLAKIVNYWNPKVFNYFHKRSIQIFGRVLDVPVTKRYIVSMLWLQVASRQWLHFFWQMQQPNNTVTFAMIKNICYSLITVNANLILLAIALGSIAQEVTAVFCIHLLSPLKNIKMWFLINLPADFPWTCAKY